MEAPSVKIDYLDKPRTLVADANAFELLEDLTGVNFFDPGVWQDMSWKRLKAILYAMAKHEDPDLTPEAMGKMLNLSNMKKAVVSVTEIFKKAAPTKEDIEMDPLAQEPESVPSGSGTNGRLPESTSDSAKVNFEN